MTNSEWDGYGDYDWATRTRGKPIEQRLVGRTVSDVWFSDDHLTFVTDAGPISYTVDADCCSSSYFNDFVGLEKLSNGPITEVKELPVEDADENKSYARNDDSVQVYGYALTTEHPKWGEMTTVFSFRNESNGYYGGSLEKADGKIYDGQVRLTEDRITS